MQSRQHDVNVSYRFYATLLDGFQDYLNSDTIWEKYWGYSENPPHTPEEFKQKQFQSFIDRINRVPFDSEAADKGTAFNEIIDCMIEHRKSDKVDVRYAYETIVMGQVDNCDPDERWAEVYQTNKVIGLNATYNNRQFYFDINLCREFANYYKGALTQQFVKAIVPTRYGNVEVYGYVDELMPQSIHDIKTTGKYSVGKFKEHWQHIVYPYCYQQNGINIRLFEYNIAEIDKYGRWETFTESYMYKPERDIPRLVNMCEELIRFLMENRHLITDRKIFNLSA
ncbi:HNH endonuclease [Barnesiella sp. WM24]|uniref:HNH endonuclease n=1 Tax=Barnesiella sp. WM24 TaxID=2558278 RepID=UPI001072920E|nr:HNH endonuclease [Barnesiella sp. WM24]TFU92942.1 HNH endonuclease [Barnesiella sp. WM24]